MTAKKLTRRTARPVKRRTSRPHRATQPKRRAPVRPLSPREREIVFLVSKATTNRGIAKALGISVHTVETHRVNAMKKLGVTNAAQLIRAAVKEKLIPR